MAKFTIRFSHDRTIIRELLFLEELFTSYDHSSGKYSCQFVNATAPFGDFPSHVYHALHSLEVSDRLSVLDDAVKVLSAYEEEVERDRALYLDDENLMPSCFHDE